MSIAIVSLSQEKTAAEVNKMLESQTYIFNAEQMLPQTGSSRTLTPGYDLSITSNKIISYLPYIGRSHAPVISGDGGIKFTSTDFEYKKGRDKDQWEITITPNDANDVRQMDLSVFDNGRATLNVTSTKRQGISYHGHITEGTMKEKKAF